VAELSQIVTFVVLCATHSFYGRGDLPGSIPAHALSESEQSSLLLALAVLVIGGIGIGLGIYGFYLLRHEWLPCLRNTAPAMVAPVVSIE
jgi:hypothetical protein